VNERGCDLVVALSAPTPSRGVPIRSHPPAPRACFGELGLTGELRWVGHPERRLEEAAKHGLTDVIAPVESGGSACEVPTLRAALASALPGGPPGGGPRTVPEAAEAPLTRVQDRRRPAGERALRPAPDPAASGG
jgi:hypothetical protein